MARAILDLPIWLVGALIIAVCAVLSSVLVLAVRPWVRRRFGEQHNVVFSDGFAALRTMYAFIAGLLVFAVFGTFQQASTVVAREASALELMYRDAHTFPEPQRSQAETAILGYVRSVIDDEWPLMAHGAKSPETDQALDRMYDVWGPMAPTGGWSDQYNQSFDKLGEVVTLRNERIQHSTATLPTIYWFVVFVGALLTVLYFALSYMPNRTMHVISVALMTVMLAVVIFLLVQVNYPFRGEVSVKVDPFTELVDTIGRIGP